MWGRGKIGEIQFKFHSVTESFHGVNELLPPEVKLLLERHCCEWDSLSVKQPLTAKNATPMHQCCAVFLHMLKRLQTVLPSADYPGAVATLRSTFLLGGLDNEILTMVTTHVPPANLKAVGAFRREAFFSGFFFDKVSLESWQDDSEDHNFSGDGQIH